MAGLPQELVRAILEHAYYTPSGTPDYALLASCSLVCTSWAAPSQSLLFCRVINLGPAATSFLAAVKASARFEKPLGHAVRSLDMRQSGGGVLGSPCTTDVFVQVLQACPRLYELSICIYQHEFDQFTLAKLKDVGQSIRALHILACGVQSPIMFQLLGIWPRIRFLKIGVEIAAWPWRHPAETPVWRQSQSNGGPDNAAQRSPASVALYDLTLSRIPQHTVLTWLLGSSAASLRILDLRESPGGTAGQVLSAHAPHLRSLRLLHLNRDSAAFLRQCTHLEEFVINTLPNYVRLAPELPPSIEHLSFRNPRHAFRETLGSIIDAIDVLPNLRILTCDKDSEGLRDFETLKAKCAERGVKVEISAAPFLLPEDPVVVRRFPRRRSVSNFALMTS